ncbi:TonB system transport protein TonB [Type-E symbiont of Plautia stali]|uniref:TonB system transport protein TonB n=1 Tax=Type-E symbiont of Plautia stali TaxID=1560357 RepID=UPI00191BE387|nr:TonB system transport protein TonB [Type-E symbiont of Plautia stali]
MTTLTTPLPTRTPVAMILSVVLHGSLIAGILYASFHQTIEVPKASQPISVTMVAPEVQPEPAPAVVTPPPEPEPEPEVAPEPPKVEPVPIPKPEPKPKPKPKPKVEKKVEPKPRKEVKPQENPVKQDIPTTQTRPTTAPKSNPAPTQNVSDGPKAMNVSKPAYPARAFALRVEGRVRVQFDVDSDGRVDNVEVLSAEPRNMFEREVKQAMKKWRYQPGRPGKGLTMNIVFRINGGANIE